MYLSLTLLNLLYDLTHFSSTWSELELGLKIVILLTIVGYVKGHIENGTISTILIAIFAYFILFYNWSWLGPLYIVYMLLTFGAAGMFVDFIFVKQMGGAPEGGDNPLTAFDVKQHRGKVGAAAQKPGPMQGMMMSKRMHP